MSIYRFTNTAGRLVHYGMDAPTGGYFFNEFLRNDEINEDGDELGENKSSLTFTELELGLAEVFSFAIPPNIFYELVRDFINEHNPTPLQLNVGKMFGHNLLEELERVRLDLLERFPVEDRREL